MTPEEVCRVKWGVFHESQPHLSAVIIKDGRPICYEYQPEARTDLTPRKHYYPCCEEYWKEEK